MEFKITAQEAKDMAQFEEEVGCDIGAGPDMGVHLGLAMPLATIEDGIALALSQVDRKKLMELLINFSSFPLLGVLGVLAV